MCLVTVFLKSSGDGLRDCFFDVAHMYRKYRVETPPFSCPTVSFYPLSTEYRTFNLLLFKDPVSLLMQQKSQAACACVFVRYRHYPDNEIGDLQLINLFHIQDGMEFLRG